MHVAADEGQTVIHAHLEFNHPETKQTQTGQVSLTRWDGSIFTGTDVTLLVLTECVWIPLFSLKYFLHKLSLLDQSDVIWTQVKAK